MYLRLLFLATLITLSFLFAPISAVSEEVVKSDPINNISKKKLPCVSHKPEKKPSCASPPLPPHSIEGTGGILIVPVAYLPNPGQNGKIFGLPTVGSALVNLRNKDLFSATITEVLWNRVELGYGFNNLQLGNVREDLKDATTLDIKTSHVLLHNFNLRVKLIEENSFNTSWVPAITAGVHYKINTSLHDIDKRLSGSLKGLGVDDDEGWDFTLTSTKMIVGLLPRPTMLTAGARLTKACHIGFLGFSDDYKLEGEFSIAQFITDRIILACEYRMKPDELDHVPGLFEKESDWMTVDIAYIATNNMTLSGGWINAGYLLNEKVDNGFGIRVMYEF